MAVHQCNLTRSMIHDSRYVFLVGGENCQSSVVALSDVEVFDMDNPNSATAVLNDGLHTGKHPLHII